MGACLFVLVHVAVAHNSECKRCARSSVLVISVAANLRLATVKGEADLSAEMLFQQLFWQPFGAVSVDFAAPWLWEYGFSTFAVAFICRWRVLAVASAIHCPARDTHLGPTVSGVLEKEEHRSENV